MRSTSSSRARLVNSTSVSRATASATGPAGDSPPIDDEDGAKPLRSGTAGETGFDLRDVTPPSVNVPLSRKPAALLAGSSITIAGSSGVVGGISTGKAGGATTLGASVTGWETLSITGAAAGAGVMTIVSGSVLTGGATATGAGCAVSMLGAAGSGRGAGATGAVISGATGMFGS